MHILFFYIYITNPLLFSVWIHVFQLWFNFFRSLLRTFQRTINAISQNRIYLHLYSILKHSLVQIQRNFERFIQIITHKNRNIFVGAKCYFTYTGLLFIYCISRKHNRVILKNIYILCFLLKMVLILSLSILDIICDFVLVRKSFKTKKIKKLV